MVASTFGKFIKNDLPVLKKDIAQNKAQSAENSKKL